MKSRPQKQYTLLALLFTVTVVYQIRVMNGVFEIVFHPERVVRDPFFLNADDATVTLLNPEATQAGLQNGDRLLAVNGKAFRGDSVLGQALAAAKPGDSITVTVQPRSQPSASARNFSITLAHRFPPEVRYTFNALYLLLNVAMPVVCIGLGFWVVFARPRDALAWLTLGVLLSFTQLLDLDVERWGPWVRDFGIVMRVLMNNTWPIWMFLFGLYFPEPFPSSWLQRWSKPLRWVVILPLSLNCAANVIAGVGRMEDRAAVAGLTHLLKFVSTPVTILSFMAVGTFFGCIATKSGMATTRDAQRRLWLLYAGTSIGMTPIFILSVTALMKNKGVEEIFPEWLVIAALLLIFLFPLTLAYVIVVHKAMEVRVVIRQGLQYALATGFVRFLQVALTALVFLAVATLATDPGRNRPQKIQLIALGITAAFLMRRGAEKLRGWTDHRFFRDAYNAEQILSELSESVRGFVETQPLLETVTQRISDSLHVTRVAVMLNGSGLYQPAFARGYTPSLDVAFPAGEATVHHLKSEAQPTRVYLDDPDSWANNTPEINTEERERLQRLQAEVLLPLRSRKDLLGFICLGQKRSEEPYSSSDLRLLQSVATQTGLALENARLTAEIADEVAQREKLNREIEIAREVQERLFPQQLPPIEGLEYCGKCRPALGVGGDYYDFLALADGGLGIAIGDVAGKGISAALMMASLQASLRGQAMLAPENLAPLMANINHLVYEASASNRYATFFYAQYDPMRRQLTYVNAGHNPPLILKKPAGSDKTVVRLDVGGTVVGLLAEFPYQQASVTLQPGDVLVAYTDGVSEAMNANDDEWGEASLLESLRACDGLQSAAMIERIMAAADAFAAGAPQHDDMTLVVVRVV